MQPVNGLSTFHVEVWENDQWVTAYQSHPKYTVSLESRGFLRSRVLTIADMETAEYAAQKRAEDFAWRMPRRERTRVVRIKTRNMQGERTVVFEREPSIL